MYEKDVIYEMLKLKYVDRKKNSEINTILGTNNTTLSKYFKKITKEKFLLHIESGESQSEFIENHPEIFSQQRENHVLTPEQCELIRELCLEHLNCYITKEDAHILRKDKLDGVFYAKHSAEWLNENKEAYNLALEKHLRKREKELSRIKTGADLGKNFKEVYELYCEEAKDKKHKPVSYGSFYSEAQKYWTEEE